MNKQIAVNQLIVKHLPLHEFTDQLSSYGVSVVQPGSYVPATFVIGQKRFFPKIDEHQIVVGGYFG